MSEQDQVMMLRIEGPTFLEFSNELIRIKRIDIVSAVHEVEEFAENGDYDRQNTVTRWRFSVSNIDEGFLLKEVFDTEEEAITRWNEVKQILS
jgi:hypothetical protein